SQSDSETGQSKSETSAKWLSSDSEPIDEVGSTTEYIDGGASIIYATMYDSYTSDATKPRFMLTNSIGYITLSAAVAMLITLV
ncbi:hypothetical protein LPJ71_003886, partial [Coemansia sp. S17]